MRIRIYLIGCLFTFCLKNAQTQSILYADYSVQPYAILSVNLLTCESTVVTDALNIDFFADFWQLPNGLIYLVAFGSGPSGTDIIVHDPTTGTSTILANLSGAPRAIYGLTDSTLLINAGTSFHIYNINQNTTTQISPQNAFVAEKEIFEYNGQLYVHGNSAVFALNLNPFELVTPSVGLFTGPMINVCNNLFSLAMAGGLGEVNFDNGTYNYLCYSGFGYLGNASVAPDPFNTSGPLCDCISESGTIQTTPGGGIISACAPNTIDIPFNFDENLDGNDNLVFVVAEYDYSNAPDVQYNILVTNSTPIATFEPGVTEVGTIYNVFVMAGNALGNSVDLSDDCLEVSAAFRIRWTEGPSVTFQAASPPCTGGCQDVQLSFDGQAPFVLSYTVTYDDGTAVPFTQTFSTYSPTIQICPPPNYEGNMQVQATNLVDNLCTCGQ